MQKLIIATGNQNKIKEMRSLLQGLEFELISQTDAGFTGVVEETGDSYVANAQLKARAVHNALGGYVLADDSGLSVDALDGYPGIYSARFGGVSTQYKDKIKMLWDLLIDVPKDKWDCAFHCAIVLIDPSGREHTFTGEWQGKLLDHVEGENGFGYDPVFYDLELKQTAAQMLPAVKNERSHRGKALAKCVAYLNKIDTKTE